MGSKGVSGDKNTVVRFKSVRDNSVESEERISMLDIGSHRRMNCDKPAVHLGSLTRENTVTSNYVGERCGSLIDGDNCEAVNLKIVEACVTSRKRDRESLCKMLNWVSDIALDPCTSLVGPVPERSDWNSHGYGEIWKQVLWAREKLFLKRKFESSSEQCAWQKCQKMHPNLYEDQIGSSYNLRDRIQCVRKLSCSQPIARSSSFSQATSNSSNEGNVSSETLNGNSTFDHPPEKCIPVGPRFQANVMEWTGVVSESDSKWIGTRIWPLSNPRNNYVIEREPIGKGRQDSCGCQFPKSIDCVRFHCSERKIRMRRELGLAFNDWDFDKMGEDYISLTTEEEKKFRDIVKLNSSHRKSLMEEFPKHFPARKKEDVVSYYYNVFLLQRRAYQNRFNPYDINSDDDESEDELEEKGTGRGVSLSPNSSLYLTKKQRKN